MRNFKGARLKVEKALKKLKRNYYSKRFERCNNDPKQTYKLLFELQGKSERKQIKIEQIKLSAEGIVQSKSEIANILNDYFSNIAVELNRNHTTTSSEDDSTNSDIGDRSEANEQSFCLWLFPTKPLEVREAIDNIDNKNSSGLDDICNLVVKSCSESLAPILTELINNSFKTGIFPEDLKRAKVFPLYNGDSKADLNNYRPISLLIVFSKNFERIMYNRIYRYVEHFQLLNSKQFGFRKKHSTIDAIAELTERLRENYKSRTVTSTVFLDLKKAFDTIDHGILGKKLTRYGICGNARNWILSFVTGRSQRTVCNGFSWDWRELNYGVPQGSVLGPLLFLIYVNDLSEACKKADVYQFADDTNVSALECSISELKDDLEPLSRWLRVNKLTLNLKKTSQVNFSITGAFSSSSISNIGISINDFTIKIDHCCRYLGLYIDYKLQF